MDLCILAQVPATHALSLGNWLVDAAAVVVILERAFSFWKNHLRESPAPPSTYTTKDDCRRNHEIVTERLQQLEEQNVAADGRRRAIYEQIDKVRRELKEDLQRLNDRVMHMPEDVIRLLRETGVIR